jgi:NAD+ synthase
MQNRIDNLVKWIRTQVPEGGKAVLGISGGKDSTIAAALCVRALGAENVVGVMMPNGVQHDIADSYAVCEYLSIFSIEVNIEDAYEGIRNSVGEALANKHTVSPYETVYGNNMIKTNLPARLRMATLYAVAALYPNSRVVNTCNYSEDYVGYSTKYGDAAGDFSPLGGFTVREVLEIGDALELPYDLVHKTPSDGMCGKTDEDNLGFTYEQLDDYIDNNKDFIPVEVCRKIEHLHKTTRHKYHPIPTYGIYGEGEEQL